MSEASQDITQQFINGGVIPGTLTGQNAVSKTYVDAQDAIRDVNIAAVAGSASAAQTSINNHLTSPSAHSAQNITYSGEVVGANNVKQAIDIEKRRTDVIVAQSGTDITELVDARGAYPVLSARLNVSDAQLADKANQIASLNTSTNNTNIITSNLLAQYSFGLKDIKSQLGVSLSIANDEVFQSRDESVSFSPAILEDKIKRIEYTIVDAGLWMMLGGTTTDFTMFGLGVGDGLGKIYNVVNTALTLVSDGVSYSYTPVNGDTIAIERQSDRYVISRKNEGMFTVFMTIIDADYPTARCVVNNLHNLGFVPTAGISSKICENVKINYNSADFQSSSGTVNPFSGKTWDVLGDSFTEQDIYPSIVKSGLGISVVHKYGISGTRITDATLSDNTAMSVRYAVMDTSAHLVTIFGGTNDYGHNMPLGTISDTTRATFYGALKVMLEGIQTLMPTARVAMFTPPQRGTSGDVANSLGNKLINYVDAIIEVCGVYGVPVLDLYRRSGINKINMATYTSDLLHPNTLGYTLIARQMVGFLNTI